MCAVCTQKKLMIGFDAEPTVVVYHKTGKHERLLDNNYPYHLNVCGLRCGLDCKGDGKNDDMLLVTAAATGRE
jgi:hypothetical protein